MTNIGHPDAPANRPSEMTKRLCPLDVFAIVIAKRAIECPQRIAKYDLTGDIGRLS
jgi:hypothetical protein